MGYAAHPPIATLVTVLKTDKRARIRKWAAKELGLRGEPGSAEVVCALSEALISDASAEVRQAALAALSAIDTSAAPTRMLSVDGLLRWLSRPSRNKYLRAGKMALVVLLYLQLLATVLSPEISFVAGAVRGAYLFVARLPLGTGFALLLLMVGAESTLLWLLWPRERPSSRASSRPLSHPLSRP